MRRKNIAKSLAVIALCLVAGYMAGCDTCDNCVDCCYDDQPPAIPTGVQSITGDEYVVVVWDPVRVDDLAGYGIYRSYYDRGPYQRIGEVERGEETEFYDYDLTNGETYFYAVDAFDYSGNESALSYETVDDTPRPEGWDMQWFTSQYEPDLAAIAILPEIYDTILLLPYDDADAQFYLTTGSQGLKRIVATGANQIQDYGYADSPDVADQAPIDGWSESPDGLEVIPGHIYILRTASGYYGKVWIQSEAPNWVMAYWAFQEQRWSTELAPRRRP
jgi:hypothetical protein